MWWYTVVKLIKDCSSPLRQLLSIVDAIRGLKYGQNIISRGNLCVNFFAAPEDGGGVSPAQNNQKVMKITCNFPCSVIMTIRTENLTEIKFNLLRRTSGILHCNYRRNFFLRKSHAIWRRKINGDTDRPTNQPTGRIKCNLPFRRFENRSKDLQYDRACIPHCWAGSGIPFRWMGTLTVLAGIFSSWPTQYSGIFSS